MANIKTLVCKVVVSTVAFLFLIPPVTANAETIEDEIVVVGVKRTCSAWAVCTTGVFGVFIVNVQPAIVNLKQHPPAPFEEPYDPFDNCNGVIMALPVAYYIDEDGNGLPESKIGPGFVCGSDENGNGIPDEWEEGIAFGRIVPDI